MLTQKNSLGTQREVGSRVSLPEKKGEGKCSMFQRFMGKSNLQTCTVSVCVRVRVRVHACPSVHFDHTVDLGDKPEAGEEADGA